MLGLIGATITAKTVATYVGLTVIGGGITKGFQTIVAKKTIDGYGKVKKKFAKMNNNK